MAKKSVVAAISDSARKNFRIPPDPEEMNDRRAGSIYAVLYNFANDIGEIGDGLDVQNLTDLIGNIGHYCDRNNIDFADILRRAQYHYDEETDNKGKQKFTAN